MGPPWMKDCIPVFIPLDTVPPECALQVGVGSYQVGQHESNRWDVGSMELGDFLLLKGCTFHRVAGGGEKGCYTLFIPFVPLGHAATMSKVHLARQLYALPAMVQFLKDAKGVPIPWESFTHFSGPLLVRRPQAMPYCGDVVFLGHGVQGATFFFKFPTGPDEPPCPLARFHRWYLPKPSIDGRTRFTVGKGSFVFTFATCGYVLRRMRMGRNGWSGQPWGMPCMWPPLVLRRRWSRTCWCSGRRRAAECSTHVGAWTIVIIIGRYAFLAHVARTHRVRFVQVPRTRYVFGAYVLTCHHVRVRHTDRTCWVCNTY